jgi:hypothetical protein
MKVKGILVNITCEGFENIKKISANRRLKIETICTGRTSANIKMSLEP